MQSEVQYLDIALAQQNQVVRLREELASDLQSGLKKNGHTPSDFLRKGFIHPACSQIYVSGLTYRPAPGFSYETVAWANSWDTRSLRELINAGSKVSQEDSERPTLDRLRDLVFNVFLLLTHEPGSVILEGPAVVRAAKVKGQNLRPELVRAKFVSEMIRPRTIRIRPAHEITMETDHEEGHENVSDTGIKRRACWVRGHWARVAHGKGHTLRRLQWLMPYPKGEFRHE